MSADNGKVCCNCRHNIREYNKEYDMIQCRCEVSNERMGYMQVMEGWCKHWSKEDESKWIIQKAEE